jgi:heme A synthase
MSDRAVRAGGTVAAVTMLALLAAGALVNSMRAALSVPDWPTSYGRWILVGRWTGNTVYEHLHRLLAVAAAVALAAYFAVVWRSTSASRLRRPAAWVVLLYAAQVALGGAVVLLRDPPWLAVVHFVVAQLVTAGVVLLVAASFGLWDAASPEHRLTRKQAGLAKWTLLLVALQILLGALSRHPSSQAAFVPALLGHLAIGLSLVVVVAWTCASVARRSRGATRALALLLGLVFLAQLAVAAPLFVISPEPLAEEWPPAPGFPLLHVLHVVLATLLLSLAALLRHRVREAAGGSAPSPAEPPPSRPG